MDSDDIPVRITKPLVRINETYNVAPAIKLELTDALERSPLKYGGVMKSNAAMDRSVSPPRNTSILPVELIPELPKDDFRHPRPVTLPWIYHGLQRPNTVSGDRPKAYERTYNPDNMIMGVPDLSTSVKYCRNTAWLRPHNPAPTSALRMAKPRDANSHRGPGCYGEDGVPFEYGTRRSTSPCMSRTERFQAPASSGVDAMYDTGAMPLAKRTEAFQNTTTISSVVERFGVLQGVDQDPSLGKLLSNIDNHDTHGTFEEVLRKSPMKYSSAFRSKVEKLPDTPLQREIKSRAKARDAVYSGAESYKTIKETLEDPKSTKTGSTLRSTTRPSTANLSGSLGPGTYTDGVHTGLAATRPRTAGAIVLPASCTERFPDTEPTYKSLSSATLVDDHILGHRPKSPEKSNMVRLKDGDGHEGLYKRNTITPDVVYRTDVVGSPAASLSTVMSASALKYSIMGPGHPPVQRDDDGRVIKPSPPKPGRQTVFAELEENVSRARETNNFKVPDPAAVTISGAPATLTVRGPSLQSSFMKSATKLDRGLTLAQAEKAVARAEEERTRLRQAALAERTIKRQSKKRPVHDDEHGQHAETHDVERLQSPPPERITSRQSSRKSLERPARPSSSMSCRDGDAESRQKLKQLDELKARLDLLDPERIAADFGLPSPLSRTASRAKTPPVTHGSKTPLQPYQENAPTTGSGAMPAARVHTPGSKNNSMQRL